MDTLPSTEPKAWKMAGYLFIGGADAFAEEIYFSGREMTERGYAMLLVATPGRGSSMYVLAFPLDLIMKYPKSVSITCSPVPRSTVSGWVSGYFHGGLLRLASPHLKTVSSASYLGPVAVQSWTICTTSMSTCSQQCSAFSVVYRMTKLVNS